MCMALLFISCRNNAPGEARYIPKDASLVLLIDPEQLTEKLQKGGISSDTLLNVLFRKSKADTADQSRIEDFRKNAGLRWESKWIIFSTQKTQADNSIASAVNCMLGLQDPQKLEAYLAKQQEMAGKVIRKEKDFTYLIAGENMIISWDKEHVIATFYQHAARPVYDTAAGTFRIPEKADTESEMKTEITRYYTQKTSESVAGVTVFTDMFKTKADGYMYASTNAALGGLANMSLQIPKLEELLKDNFSTATLSFEEGRILANTTFHANPALAAILKQYAGPVVNPAMIEHYPSNNINGILLASFNPEIFGGVLRQLEVEGVLNSLMEKTGFTSKDLYQSLKGDIAVVISDLGRRETDPFSKKDEHGLARNKPFGHMLLTAPVGDKNAFTRIMDKAAEQGMIKKDKGVYRAGDLVSAAGLFFLADDKNLFVASDSAVYAAYIAGKEKAIVKDDVKSAMKGKSTFFYFDIAGTIHGFDTDSTGSFHQSMKTARETFRDVICSSDNFDGKTVKGLMEIRLQNKTQNSIVTLTSLITDIAVDYRLMAKKEKESEEKLFPGGVPAIIRTN
jgi:hypothetical protein